MSSICSLKRFIFFLCSSCYFRIAIMLQNYELLKIGMRCVSNVFLYINLSSNRFGNFKITVFYSKYQCTQFKAAFSSHELTLKNESILSFYYSYALAFALLFLIKIKSKFGQFFVGGFQINVILPVLWRFPTAVALKALDLARTNMVSEIGEVCTLRCSPLVAIIPMYPCSPRVDRQDWNLKQADFSF